MTSTQTKIEPAEELAAWNAWKKICFVDGCPPAQRAYLRRRIIARITQELKKYQLGEQWENRLDDDEIISEFDLFLAYRDGLPGIIREQAVARHQFKQHKDYIWHKLNHSADPPMKVLNGYLLGPRGMIMDVLRKLLKTHYLMRDIVIVDPKSGKEVRRLQAAESLQAPIVGSAHAAYTLEARLANEQLAPDQMTEENSEETHDALASLIKTLDKEEKLLLLAQLLRINFSAPAFTQALGKGKSTAYALAQKMQEKIQAWYRKNDNSGLATLETHQTLCRLLLTQLQEETATCIQEFLRLAEECLALKP